MLNAVGYKIALTSEATQQKYNTDEPAMGILYADKVFTNGAKIKMDDSKNYRVECELGFKFKENITEMPTDDAALIDMIDYVFPAIEVVEIPKEGAEATLDYFTSKNCYFGAAVLGDKIISPSELDWELTGMRLELNGLLKITGISAAVMDNPINALKWLVKKAIDAGTPVKESDIIISGSMIAAVEASAGDYFRASFLNLGDVTVFFEKTD